MTVYKDKEIPKWRKLQIKRANWRARSTAPKGGAIIHKNQVEEEEHDIHAKFHRKD